MDRNNKMCEGILKRLNSIEASAQYLFKRKGSKLTQQAEFDAFIKGINHAREAVLIETGVVVRKSRG